MTDAKDPQNVSFSSPVQDVLALTLGVVHTQALRVAAELRIADLLDGEPLSVEELAKMTGTDSSALARVIAVLAQLRLVKESVPGRFVCTEAGSLLRTDVPNSINEYAILMGQECFTRGWSDLLYSVQTGESAFVKTMGCGVYEYFRAHPAVGSVMHQAMSQLSRQEGAAIRDAYDFSPYRHIVDVGGGRGGLLSILLSASPDAHGTLMDLPDVVAEAVPVLASAGIADRCEVIGGDFLTHVPDGGDLYLLKRILIDRTDHDALALLRNIRSAMRPGGRVLIADPHPGSAYGKYFDLFMLMVFAGRIRPESELKTLFETAGFTLTRTFDTHSAIRLVEGAPHTS